MGRKTAFILLFLLGYLIGMGIYGMITITIPAISEFIYQFNPWLLNNVWFIQSMISGLTGGFILVTAAFIWTKSKTEI